LLSVLAAYLIAQHYYEKTCNDLNAQRSALNAQQSTLESLGENIFRAIKAANPDKSGDVFKALNGKYAQKWETVVNEPVIEVKDEEKGEVMQSNESG
jgi:hypothetical protein